MAKEFDPFAAGRKYMGGDETYLPKGKMFEETKKKKKKASRRRRK